jgi:hypothetical protein
MELILSPDGVGGKNNPIINIINIIIIIIIREAFLLLVKDWMCFRQKA